MFNQDNVTKDGFLDQLFRRMGYETGLRNASGCLRACVNVAQ